MISKIRDLYKQYRDSAHLKKHGCKTWKEYHRKYDPDYNNRATRIVDIYHGYPWVHCFENHAHEVYWSVDAWCAEHCTDKYRFDWHRVCKNYWGELEINEIGGGDYIFLAFKNEHDYVQFRLSW